VAAAPGSGGSGSVAVDELRADPVGMLDLLARTADGMVAISPTGTILRWNDGAAELLGYEEREVVGRPCHEILGFLDRCGNAVCSAFCSGRRPTAAERDDVLNGLRQFGLKISADPLEVHVDGEVTAGRCYDPFA